MKVLHKTGREVVVGDWLAVKDYKGKVHRYEVLEFEVLMVRVAEHAVVAGKEQRYLWAIPYTKLGLRSPYVD